MCNTRGGGLTVLFYSDHVCTPECDGDGGCQGGRSEKGRANRVRKAKRICAACPVSAECLDFAQRHLEKFGIWGGLTERERARLRKEARDAD